MIIQLPPIDDGCRLLGDRLRAVREARAVSLDHLAELSGLSSADLSLTEHGRARLTSVQLHAVIMALRIPLALLFADVDLRRMRPL